MNQNHRAQAALYLTIRIIDHIERSPFDNDAAFLLLGQRIPLLKEKVTSREDVLDYIINNKALLREPITKKNMIHYMKEGFAYSYKEVMEMLNVTRPTILKYIKEEPDDVHTHFKLDPLKMEWLFYEYYKIIKEPKPYTFMII